MNAGNNSTSDFIKVKNGYAVVLNHLNYADNLNLESRTGTECDVSALQKTFEKFNITAIVKNELTLNQIKDEVSRLQEFDFKDFECLIIVVLSHGLTKNTLFASDGEYNFNEVIVDPIINKNASLANKPKIFIIQACKGTKAPITCDIRSDARPTYINDDFTVPSIADMFFCFATSEDYAAYIKNNGSFFIQKLCSTLQKHGFEMSINDIMENVGAELRVSDFHVQVPSVTKTTTRPIIFVENDNPIRLKLVNRKILKNGYATIFNQEIFDHTLGVSERVGTSHDETELYKTLENFNISVKVHNDLTIAGIKEEVKKLQDFNFSSYDCFIVIILSHGNENNILMARDGAYEFYETIAIPVVNKNKTLVGKPKIFLIQACKGSKQPHIIRADGPSVYKRVPMIMDMFYIFSTYEGHVSFRNTMEGTFFIQTFCQLLNQYKNTLSLNDILEHTVRKLIQSESKYKQVPTITKTMVKAIFFIEKNSIFREVLDVADGTEIVSELMPVENNIEVLPVIEEFFNFCESSSSDGLLKLPTPSVYNFEKQMLRLAYLFQRNLLDPSKTNEEILERVRVMLQLNRDTKATSPEIISKKGHLHVLKLNSFMVISFIILLTSIIQFAITKRN